MNTIAVIAILMLGGAVAFLIFANERLRKHIEEIKRQDVAAAVSAAKEYEKEISELEYELGKAKAQNSVLVDGAAQDSKRISELSAKYAALDEKYSRHNQPRDANGRFPPTVKTESYE